MVRVERRKTEKETDRKRTKKGKEKTQFFGESFFLGPTMILTSF
jgi:hypothetical protein